VNATLSASARVRSSRSNPGNNFYYKIRQRLTRSGRTVTSSQLGTSRGAGRW
jgi:hypothetical protein